MKVIYIISVIMLKNICCSASTLKGPKYLPTSEEIIPALDFPDVEYPQSVLEANPFFYKSNAVLDPFTDDVQSLFKLVAKSPKNHDSNELPIIVTEDNRDIKNGNIGTSKLEINNDNSRAFEKAIKTLADKGGKNIYEGTGQQTNSSTETYDCQIERPTHLNNTEKLESHKSSSIENATQEESDIEDNSDKGSWKHSLRAQTTVISEAAVLPRPPNASDNVSMSVSSAETSKYSDKKASQEDMLHSPVCEKNCVVEKLSSEEIEDL